MVKFKINLKRELRPLHCNERTIPCVRNSQSLFTHSSLNMRNLSMIFSFVVSFILSLLLIINLLLSVCKVKQRQRSRKHFSADFVQSVMKPVFGHCYGASTSCFFDTWQMLINATQCFCYRFDTKHYRARERELFTVYTDFISLMFTLRSFNCFLNRQDRDLMELTYLKNARLTLLELIGGGESKVFRGRTVGV